MLNVDLKVLRSGCLLVCRGDVIGEKEADYLFNLITREDKGDVILDLDAVSHIDSEGLSVIALAYEVLAGLNRRLFLRSPSPDLIAALRKHRVEAIYDSYQRRTETPSRSVH